MKFKVKVNVEILDDKLLGIINDSREWDDLEPYNEISEVPKEEILKLLNEDGFMSEEIAYYSDFDEMEIIIVEE